MPCLAQRCYITRIRLRPYSPEALRLSPETTSNSDSKRGAVYAITMGRAGEFEASTATHSALGISVEFWVESFTSSTGGCHSPSETVAGVFAVPCDDAY